MNKYIILFFSITLFLLNSCTELDDGGTTSENAVYMGNPNSSGIIGVTVNDEKGGSFVITPRLANITNKPVTVTVAVDQKLLDEYNKRNNLAIETLDIEDFEFVTSDGVTSHGEATITIDKGMYIGSIEVKIDSINAQKYPHDKRLAIPVTIKAVDGYKLLSSPKWTLLQLNRQLKTSVGLMSRGNIELKPKAPFTEPMDEWTFQMSVIYSSLTRRNLTTAWIDDHGGGEFYTRIANIPGYEGHGVGIQVKNGRDGADTWTQKPLKAGEWLHISYVYKNQTVSVLINGELHKTFETTPIYLKNTPKSGWTVGNDSYSNDYIRELRFWDKALTQAEINDKLYLPQDPETPGLIMYMPITKESALEELTGNWNVTKGSNTTMEYIDNVIFPAEKLIIEEPEVINEDNQ